MARDLAGAGIELTNSIGAGRWQTATMTRTKATLSPGLLPTTAVEEASEGKEVPVVGRPIPWQHPAAMTARCS